MTFHFGEFHQWQKSILLVFSNFITFEFLFCIDSTYSIIFYIDPSADCRMFRKGLQSAAKKCCEYRVAYNMAYVLFLHPSMSPLLIANPQQKRESNQQFVSLTTRSQMDSIKWHPETPWWKSQSVRFVPYIIQRIELLFAVVDAKSCSSFFICSWSSCPHCHDRSQRSCCGRGGRRWWRNIASAYPINSAPSICSFSSP